jgi:hypothetical protein
MASMTFEKALGTVIRALNPYTDGSAGSMQFSSTAPPATITVEGVDVGDIHLEIDDYHDDREAWVFKAQPHRIQRALRIQYRHKTKGEAGKAGVWVTENLLIGFSGANGGS